jgi:hypothetical protein
LVDSIDLLSYSNVAKSKEKKSCSVELFSVSNKIKEDVQKKGWEDWEDPKVWEGLVSYLKDAKVDLPSCNSAQLLPSFKVLKLDVKKKGSSKEIFYEFEGDGEGTIHWTCTRSFGRKVQTQGCVSFIRLDRARVPRIPRHRTLNFLNSL